MQPLRQDYIVVRLLPLTTKYTLSQDCGTEAKLMTYASLFPIMSRISYNLRDPFVVKDGGTRH